MDEYAGEKFLDKLYNNVLYNSPEVQHSKKNTDNRYEAIRRYLERLEKSHEKANTQRRKEILKDLYYEKYIIKEDILKKKIKEMYPNASEELINEEIKTVIQAQKKSLSDWIDYLTSDDAHYPLWAKYWAFQGMLKMGNYDEGIEGYQKRSEDTESPFVDANPEIIAKAIEIIQKSVNKEDLEDEELEKLIKSGNFSKIYTVLEKRYNQNVIEYSGTEGIWVKYNQGSKEDAIKLSKSLENKNTHWCTAESSMAIRQVCGPYDNEDGGDFYVYYTKDKDGNYTLPRIAIRMEGHDEIGEIRGILEGQNLEEDMTSILEEKLKEMTFINKNDKKDALDKVNGLKELTRIYKKTVQKEELTQEELKNLYTKQYGFGWTQDPRVDKTKKKRNSVEDFENIKDYNLQWVLFEKIVFEQNKEIELKDEEFVRYCIETGRIRLDVELIRCFNPKYSKDYNALAKYVVEKRPPMIMGVKPDYVDNYTELVNYAVKKGPYLLKEINPKYVDNYSELAILAVSEYAHFISSINPDDVNNYSELAEIAVKKNPYLLKDINPKYTKNYEELAAWAAKEDIDVVEFINPEYASNYTEIINDAFNKMPDIISKRRCKAKYIKNYEELAYKYVNIDVANLYLVDAKCISDYDKLVKFAIDKDANAIEHANLVFVKDYDTLAKYAVTKDANALDSIIYYVSDYDELVLLAINSNSFAIVHANLVFVKDYDKLVKIVMKNKNVTEQLMYDSNNWFMTKQNNKITFMKTVLKYNGLYINNVRINDQDVSENYQELAAIAVKQNKKALRYVIYNMVDMNELKKITNTKEKETNTQKLGFIDIFSITALLFALGFTIITIMKIFNN